MKENDKKTDEKQDQKKNERKEFFEVVRRSELLKKSPIYEHRMCNILKAYGIDFVRQYPIWTGRKVFFADIYIPSSRLIIEMDGGYHFTEDQRRLDKNRSQCIRRKGMRVIRFANGDLRNVKKVVDKILYFVHK